MTTVSTNSTSLRTGCGYLAGGATKDIYIISNEIDRAELFPTYGDTSTRGQIGQPWLSQIAALAVVVRKVKSGWC